MKIPENLENVELFVISNTLGHLDGSPCSFYCSCILADTIIIGEPQDQPVMGMVSSSNHLVTNFSTEWSNVSFDLDVDDSPSKTQEETAIRILEESGRRVTRGMVRAEQRQLEMMEDESALMRRAKHQEKLHFYSV